MESEPYKDFIDYSKWILIGWFIGLIVGILFDYFFSFGNPILEGITRFIAGYSDTIGASVSILIVYRLKKKRKSIAETFWTGTVIGSLAGPLVHLSVLSLGLSTSGIAGAVYAIAYSNADNWGGVIFSLVKKIRKYKSTKAFSELYKEKFVLANIFALIFLAIIDIVVRLYGFGPNTYFTSALEGALLDNDSTLAILIFFIYVNIRKIQRAH